MNIAKVRGSLKMKIYKCPGQDDRNLKIETLKCFNCGYGIEIFSDELKVACPECKTWNYRQRLPSCVDWCKMAGECVGKGKLARLRRKV
jgi:hypothetical protein